MSFKVKTVLKNDIRVFNKKDIESMKEALELIHAFIKEKYGINNDNYIINYEDEEHDLINIVTSADLQDAFNYANQNGHVLKIFIVPSDQMVNNENDDKSKLEEKQDGEKKEEKEESNNNMYENLINNIMNNEEFRNEFINFIITFVTILQNDKSKDMNNAFLLSLNIHENISKHPLMKTLIEIFPILIHKFQPFVFLIDSIDVNNIGEWLNNIINMYGNKCNGNSNNNGGIGNNAGLMPILMQLLSSFGKNQTPFTPSAPSSFNGCPYQESCNSSHPLSPWLSSFNSTYNNNGGCQDAACSNQNNNDEMIEQEEEEEDGVIISSNIEDNDYKYSKQLNEILLMGFDIDNIDYIKQLLNDNNGNIDAVINHIFAY
jgi:hypothetical protein